VIVKQRIHASEVDDGLAEPDAYATWLEQCLINGPSGELDLMAGTLKDPFGVLPTELLRGFSSGLRPK
jgi:hypothetical protein